MIDDLPFYLSSLIYSEDYSELILHDYLNTDD